ncbi:hypothetical protein B0H11DRAFT_2193769 [Mycena galericulata]|nr:hypothetical protein B0H11DRAFT_2193769 [Mycena galericulata]
MAVTRSSASPRTRSSSSQNAYSASLSSSSPRRNRTRSRANLEAKHALLYPATTSLGVRGLKKDKRREVARRLRALLELYSPRPDQKSPRNYGNHRLGDLTMNTGFKSRRDDHAGSWVQPCEGHCDIDSCNGRVFVVTDPLPRHILHGRQFRVLFRARKELYATHYEGHVLPHELSPTPTPPPSIPTAAGDFAAPEAEEESVSLERSLTPRTPTLRFDFGGYGGVHYTPDGYIIHHASRAEPRADDSESDGIPELQYPRDVLDVCTPALLVGWYDNTSPPIQMMVQPRADQPPTCRIGEVVLEDFKVRIGELGFPTTSEIERFIDATDHWIPTTWDKGVPIYGRNKVIYIRAVGVDITPPDHVVELLVPGGL